MKRNLSIVATSLLVGCAPLPSVYNPESQPPDQLATVIAYDDKGAFPEHGITEVIKVWDDNQKLVIDYRIGTVHEKLSIPEGNYHFLMRCQNPPLLSTPQISVHLEEAEEYTVFCEKIVDKNWILGGRILGHRVRIVKSRDFSTEIIETTVINE
jgi:hypothetical protein